MAFCDGVKLPVDNFRPVLLGIDFENFKFEMGVGHFANLSTTGPHDKILNCLAGTKSVLLHSQFQYHPPKSGSLMNRAVVGTVW